MREFKTRKIGADGREKEQKEVRETKWGKLRGDEDEGEDEDGGGVKRRE